MLLRLIAALFLLMPVACGTSQFDRVSTGAGTGAATGAGIGLIGGPIGVGAGALIGAGAGALAGDATDPDQLNLGRPIWE
jgi:hypothetical protein